MRLLALLGVCFFFIMFSNYSNQPASASQMKDVSKAIELSNGQPFEAEFKRKISPMIKDGLTNKEAVEIVSIYNDLNEAQQKAETLKKIQNEVN